MKRQPVTMKLKAAAGVFEDDPFEILTLSRVGGRGLGTTVARIAMTREGLVMTHDKARVGVLVPVPYDREEAFRLLKNAPDWPTDRALRTAVRTRLINGEILGVASGRMKRHKPRYPDAFLVPYPHTVVLADYLTDKLWVLVEELPLRPID
jgi:hypothetical protein